MSTPHIIKRLHVMQVNKKEAKASGHILGLLTIDITMINLVSNHYTH